MLNYVEARKQLGTRETKKLARNTYLREDHGNMVIKFWETDIVKIDPQDIYTLNTGGYLTTTTKERLNSFTPARIGADKGLWYVHTGSWSDDTHTRVLFADGIQVNKDGYVLSGAGAEEVPASMRKVDRLVTKYIAGYAADVMARGYPDEETGGDCFGCKFGASGEEPLGYDHYLSHFHEEYYVPGILIKAIQEVGYGSPSVVWHMMKADIAQGREPYHMKSALRKYFRARKIGIAKELAAGWTFSE